MNNKNIKKGFSLLELLAIIGIIVIMTSAAIIMGSNSAREKKLDAAARRVESAINLAHSNTLTGKGAGSTPGGCSYRFWHYVGTAANASTVRYGVGDEGGPGVLPSCQNIEYKLEGGVYFYAPAAAIRSLEFGIPHGNVISPTTELAIVLRIAGTTVERTICINNRGATRILTSTGASCDFASW